MPLGYLKSTDYYRDKATNNFQIGVRKKVKTVTPTSLYRNQILNCVNFVSALLMSQQKI